MTFIKSILLLICFIYFASAHFNHDNKRNATITPEMKTLVHNDGRIVSRPLNVYHGVTKDRREDVTLPCSSNRSFRSMTWVALSTVTGLYVFLENNYSLPSDFVERGYSMTALENEFVGLLYLHVPRDNPENSAHIYGCLMKSQPVKTMYATAITLLSKLPTCIAGWGDRVPLVPGVKIALSCEVAYSTPLNVSMSCEYGGVPFTLDDDTTTTDGLVHTRRFVASTTANQINQNVRCTFRTYPNQTLLEEYPNFANSDNSRVIFKRRVPVSCQECIEKSNYSRECIILTSPFVACVCRYGGGIGAPGEPCPPRHATITGSQALEKQRIYAHDPIFNGAAEYGDFERKKAGLGNNLALSTAIGAVVLLAVIAVIAIAMLIYKRQRQKYDMMNNPPL